MERKNVSDSEIIGNLFRLICNLWANFRRKTAKGKPCTFENSFDWLLNYMECSPVSPDMDEHLGILYNTICFLEFNWFHENNGKTWNAGSFIVPDCDEFKRISAKTCFPTLSNSSQINSIRKSKQRNKLKHGLVGWFKNANIRVKTVVCQHDQSCTFPLTSSA